MYFKLVHFMSKTTFTMSMYTQIKFSWTDNGKVQKLFILKLDPEPEKLSEHGAWIITGIFYCMYIHVSIWQVYFARHIRETTL